jgi:hypothetical protein
MLLVLLASACGSDPAQTEEAQLVSMRLAVGGQTLIYSRGTTLAATIMGATTQVSASFLAAGGAALTLDGDEFEIRLIPRATGVITFNRATPFSGSISRLALGSVIVDLQVFDKLQTRSVFDAVLNVNSQ